ncbi:hypothetical protein GF318_02235 [Candidatus Micrarchaeota archaeon]|nr:hypothetical protein [Candidatus Micrarchaeota archaeon]
MAVRREVLLIVALLVMIALLVKVVEFFKVDVVEADAREFVMEDLNSRYPAAEIGVISVTPRYNMYEDRYFEVKAKVTKNPDSPCPERIHIYYNYPVQNFVPQPADVITSGCEVCTEGICVVAFEEEAVIASHTFEGTSPVQSYIDNYPEAEPQAAEELDTWIVMWNSENADFYYTATIHRNGSVLEVQRTEK